MEKSFDENLKRSVEMFRRNDRLHRMLFERQAVESFGIHRSQHITLMYIARHEDANQRSIADHFEISPAAVATTLKKLEAGGFIVRTACDTDCRKNQIRITKKGQNVINQTHILFSGIDYAMFEGIDEKDMNVLANCLEKMNDNLRAEAEKTLHAKEGEHK